MAVRIVECRSPNRDARPEGSAIDMLILHYTGMKTAEEALARLCDPEARVSAHYTIDRDGRVYRHVPEELRAWHAGVSYWAGERNINGCSIGIELVNPGHEFGYVPFPDAQMASLIDLAGEIMARHRILPARVLGHSDIAPARKDDPGELFPWAELAEFGIGIWPFAGNLRPTVAHFMRTTSSGRADVSASPLRGGRNRPRVRPEAGPSVNSAISGGGEGFASHPANPVQVRVRRPPHEGEVECDSYDADELFADDLRAYGYGVPPEVDVPFEKVVTAFQRHWRTSAIDGRVDDESAYRLGALLAALS